jgi:hypothetical protein
MSGLRLNALKNSAAIAAHLVLTSALRAGSLHTQHSAGAVIRL